MTSSDIIEFFSNKKTTIATVIAAILVWALGRGYVQQDTAQLITEIMVAIGAGSNYLTAKYYREKDASGMVDTTGLGKN